MAIKAILEDVSTLNDSLKGEYKKGDDGKFYLDIEGLDNHPGVGALARAKEHEKVQRQQAVTKATEAQAALDKLTEERDNLLKGAIPKADVEKLEASYKDKLSKRETELKAEVASMTSSLHTLLVENVATSLAKEISKAPDLMIPHIKGRLKAEIVEGRPFTRVLDKDGNLSAASIEDFKKEIVANPIFAPIIIGSKASGSSAISTPPTGSSAPATGKKLAEMTPRELADHLAAQNSPNS